MSGARERILAKLRSKPGGEVPPLPALHTTAAAPPPPFAERLATFADVLGRLGSVVEVVADEAAAARRVEALLAEFGARSLALSDAPEVVAVAGQLGPSIECLPHDADRERLLTAEAGLSSAQFAIAETGTLVLTSEQERHRLCTLLPDLHVAIVPAARLVATLGDAFAALAPDGQPNARTITFVTGPSRTADIELQLVVGVHGPKALKVLVLGNG
ncbi:MAG: lactate utilization protein [Planctomycetes bacterium]|nr:lactate utilization protein [Planctomycetota bacterium]